MLTVGYIGLGLMGKSMARNILKAGFPVVVHNRSHKAVDELVLKERLQPHHSGSSSESGCGFHQPARLHQMYLKVAWERMALSTGHIAD